MTVIEDDCYFLSVHLRNGSVEPSSYHVIMSYGCTQEVAKHERSITVARCVAESNSSLLSAKQTSQVHP